MSGRTRRGFAAVTAEDEGSGTMAGVALIMLAAVLITASAAAGHLVIRHAQTRSAADLAAFSAATAWWNDQESPCAVADTVAQANGATVVECQADEPDDGDVTVRLAMDTQVPLVPQITVPARAGPVECE